MRNSCRLAVGGFAAALALGVSALGPSAIAKPVITGWVDQTAVKGIEQQCGHSFSLTVRLPKGNPFDDVPVGELPPGNGSGYVFTISRVKGVDLTTLEGWNRAGALTVSDVEQLERVDFRTATTTETGEVTFDNVEPGIYLVETQKPADSAHENLDVPAFAVTVPIGQDGTWVCDAVVYAKTSIPNSPDEPPTTPPTTPPGVPPNIPGPPADHPGEPPASPPGNETEVPPTPPSENPRPSWLANTGASVLWVIGSALLLIGLGWIFLLLSRRHGTEE
ncbi:hypothetical protein GCM10028828_03680 [Corynebacterium tapiri]